MKMKQAHKTLLALGLCLTFVITGCKNSDSNAKPTKVPTATVEAVQTSESESSTEENNLATADTHDVIDMAGRTITLPNTINKAIPMTPRAQVLIYTLNPDKLAGWNYDLTDAEKKYMAEPYQNLPVLGGTSGKEFNLEEIAKINPEVIIYSGPIDEKAQKDVDLLESQLNIPVIMVTTDLLDIPTSYAIIGDAIDDKERGEKLAAYCQESLTYFEEKGKSIPDAEKRTVYYAEGTTGLETEPEGAERISTLPLIGAKNVCEKGPLEGGGKMEVSFEQVAVWNPEVIIIGTNKGQSSDLYQSIFTDATWSTLEAVQNKNVIVTPFGPFNWFDRPYSVNRILGGYWLGKTLYPDVYNDYNLKEKTISFYKEFYWFNLTDTAYEELIGSALLPTN